MLYKVLIVEDEVFMREGLKNLIDWKELGFEIVGEAEDGPSAFEFMKKMQVDVLISDIKIPLLSGLDLIEKVKREIKNPPEVIIISGYADFEYAKKAIQHGVVNYILKPIEEEELVETLQKVKSKLKKRELIKEGRSLFALERSFKESIENSNIKIENGIFVGIVYFKEMSNWLNFYLDERIENMLLRIKGGFEQLKKEGLMYEFSEIGDKYYVVAASEENIQEAYQKLKKMIDFATEIVFAFSRKITKWAQFFDAIYEAAYSLNFALFYNQMGITFYSNSLPNSKELLYSKEYDKRLILAIEENSQDIQKIVEEMMEDIRKGKYQLEFLMTYLSFVVVSISSYFSRMGLNLEDEIEYFSNLRLEFSNIEDIQKNLLKFCEGILNKFRQWRASLSNGIICELEKYIKENYNKNLTLKSVAQRFYINPVYLGQLFKKHYGMYFNSYLQKIRVEEAKKLLMSTNMKIYEISQAVGYNDTDYFIQCFTKLCNMTPNQFRKKCRKV
ncbi:response regulator transcription factor [Caldicellulosiruptor sp. F32]|uniref:response regulator transcription factor n=1 Tax=Caldicellulosiruptor sp. F32 TaxID=1214564 RepID=UPI0003A2EFC4|nr:response regulator transcription factor [Caldicellulosiruptor sp. F32]